MIYVCSDIHGVWDKYEAAKYRLTEDDRLIIIGDVIDRNPDGVKILQDIMKSDNVELLIGNHESMMIESMHNKEWFDIWMNERNGGRVTHLDLLKLEKEEVKEMVRYLKNCNVYKRLEVNGKKFLLVHGGNVNQEIEGNKEKYCKIKESLLESILWNSKWKHGIRRLYTEDFCDDETTIVGHVPVQIIGEDNDYTIYKDNNVICVDGGLAMHKVSSIDTKLILYCLDTDETYYL